MIKGLIDFFKVLLKLKICRILFFILSIFFNFSITSAENISEDRYQQILKEAKVFYKGIDRYSLGTNGDCVWDYHTFGSEWFNIRNQQYKFGDITFYSLGCVFGMYNYWSVWMKEEIDGSLIPLTFAYPFYIDGYVEDQEDPSQMIGMTTTRLLCNPTVKEEKMTITTKCLGRGIGDYFSSGTWQYIGQKDYETDFDVKDDFLLIKFESDLIDDMKEKPVILYEVKE